MPLPSQALAPAFSAPDHGTPSLPGPLFPPKVLTLTTTPGTTALASMVMKPPVALASRREALLFAGRVEGDSTFLKPAPVVLFGLKQSWAKAGAAQHV